MPRGNQENSQTTKATLGLRELLLSGAFKPRERVPELRLVEELGVSRTPLRIALMTLEHEGLLETLPGGGFVVREFTLSDIDDAIELRGVLEGTAARFAAERLESEDELELLRELCRRARSRRPEPEHGDVHRVPPPERGVPPSCSASSRRARSCNASSSMCSRCRSGRRARC